MFLTKNILTSEFKCTILKTFGDKCNVLFVITPLVGRGLLDKEINCNKVILVHRGSVWSFARFALSLGNLENS